MKTRHLLLCSIAFVLAIFSQMCTSVKEKPFVDNDPIIGAGHGALFGPDGKELDVNEDMILSSQQYFIDKLLNTESAKNLF